MPAQSPTSGDKLGSAASPAWAGDRRRATRDGVALIHHVDVLPGSCERDLACRTHHLASRDRCTCNSDSGYLVRSRKPAKRQVNTRPCQAALTPLSSCSRSSTSPRSVGRRTPGTRPAPTAPQSPRAAVGATGPPTRPASRRPPRAKSSTTSTKRLRRLKKLPLNGNLAAKVVPRGLFTRGLTARPGKIILPSTTESEVTHDSRTLGGRDHLRPR
jgi:hypothetical protein